MIALRRLFTRDRSMTCSDAGKLGARTKADRERKRIRAVARQMREETGQPYDERLA